ncbi:hypothetical protein Bca52824_035950 [Brassica carinata]|uniref:Uncharacterized protein n=1 Tax=Brassica carinata TaxID=52824 RepID=A0A8X7S567_BRACI|nr:hypothetical protein Bca52824_035950 [Brassica carinata]
MAEKEVLEQLVDDDDKDYVGEEEEKADGDEEAVGDEDNVGEEEADDDEEAVRDGEKRPKRSHKPSRSLRSPFKKYPAKNREQIGSNNIDSNSPEAAIGSAAIDNDAPRTVESDDMTVEADRPAGFSSIRATMERVASSPQGAINDFTNKAIDDDALEKEGEVRVDGALENTASVGDSQDPAEMPKRVPSSLIC